REKWRCCVERFEPRFQVDFGKKRWAFNHSILEDVRKEKRFPTRVANHTVFLRIGLHYANRGIADQACITRKLYPDRGRNRDPCSGIGAGAKSDNNRFRSAKRSLHGLEVLKKRYRIFSIVRPFTRELDCALQPGQAASRSGKFKRESFHDGDESVMTRWRSDLISKAIHRAPSGIKSGNRSAHSITETPSLKK